jgi:hypothetical protein
MRHRPEPGISTSAPVLKAIAKVTVQCDFDELFPLVVPLLGIGSRRVRGGPLLVAGREQALGETVLLKKYASLRD